MTLLVLADESDDFQALGETLAALMPQHPARAIIIRLRPSGRTALAGRVFAQCWMPFGQRRQICCEQIEITAPESEFPDALALADAIAAPDLPVVAWCRSIEMLRKPGFRKMAPRASRVIVDSAAVPNPQAAIAMLAEFAAPGIHVADLSWTRLTRWREMISQSFENQERRSRLRGTVQIRVEFSGSSAPVSARYMAAWLAESLKAFGASISLNLVPAADAKPGELQRVELATDGLHIELHGSNGRLQIAADGISHCVSLTPFTDYALMCEELGVMRSDPVFERTLAAAKNL